MEYSWTQQYANAVPVSIDLSGMTSFIDFLDAKFLEHKERTAFLNMGSRLTYQKLFDLSCDFSSYLQHVLGLKKGERVAIMMPNLLQYPVALLGILRAGLVVVNVNPLYTAAELVHQLNDAQVSAIIILSNFATTLEAALPNLNDLRHIITTDPGDLLGSVKGPLVNFAAKHLKKMIPSYTLPNAIGFKKALSLGHQKSFAKVNLTLDDLAFLQYTGGTTGTAKGAMLTHRNVLANTLQCVSWIDYLFDCNDVVLTALPLYHIYSLTVCCFTFISIGATCLLVTNPRDMASFIRILKKNTVSMFVGISTLFKGLLKQPAFSALDFSKIKVTCHGGMPLQKELSDWWQAVTGLHIVDGYGLTEASPVVAMNPVCSAQFRERVGLPIPSTEIVIRDANGIPLKSGDVGEIFVRGPQVMVGYWQQPEETAKVIDSEGWLATGDIGYMDAAGFVTVTDRKKDIIIVSGFNVYPSEIETVLFACEGVMESAVIGVPCEKRGESIKAFVVRNTSKLSKEDLLQFCSQRLTRYKIPQYIEFCDTLPKSPVGKILKKCLKNPEKSVVC